MPIYDFNCSSCHKEVEAYVAKIGDGKDCSECKTPMERVWRMSTEHHGTSIYPYTTTHITGKPLEIKSASHLKRLEKQHGVRLRDDATWVEKQFEGFDHRKGEYRYKEGSGGKGRWF